MDRSDLFGTPAALCLLLACGSGDTLTGPQVATVDVVPDEALIVGVGDGIGFSAIARDANDLIVAGSPEWSVADPGVASIMEGGFATGIATGVTTVTATIGGVSGSARLEVFVPEHVVRYEPGQSYFGRNDYVEYIPGELPVVLSAPHGGALAPSEIPNRSYGVTARDRNTLELTLGMRDALINLTGQAPHVIISHLHRSKLDPNREIVEAAQESPYAELAWDEFQEWIKTARSIVAGDFGKGMYFDIHGHGHDIDRIEVGYLLSADELNQPDIALNSLEVVARTSIRDLGRTSPIPFSQLLRGPTSFGGLLEEEGIASVPSPSAPGPGDAPYFRGGYNTREHGSAGDAEVISGMQLEHHFGGLRDSEENRSAYAVKAAKVIRAFMLEHYGFFETRGVTGELRKTSPGNLLGQGGFSFSMGRDATAPPHRTVQESSPPSRKDPRCVPQ